MTRTGSAPVLLVVGAVVSVQFGAAFAAILIGIVGVAGSVALRLGLAFLVLVLVARPRLRGHPPAAWRDVVLFGLALAAMNTAFYASLARLPLAVAVTIEFVGPMALAAALSRRWQDGLAVLAAASGVVLIARVATTGWADLDLLGLGLALTAGAAWAAYILLSGRVGAHFPGLDGLALAMAVAALVTVPAGIAVAGTSLAAPKVLAWGLGVALLSSAIPYSLELLALRALPAGVFGVLLSIEPAAAALAGFLILGELLGVDQLAGMALVVAASVAITRRPSHQVSSPG